MRISLTCPVELRGYELVYDDHRHVRVYLSLMNLSQLRVERMDIRVTFYDSTGRQAVQTFHNDELSVAARSAFSWAVFSDDITDCTHLEVVFLRVILDGDEPVYMHNPMRMVDLPDLPKPDGRELNRLIDAAGADAVCFPFQSGNLWICVCGRANGYRKKQCARCERERDIVLTRYNITKLLKTPATQTTCPAHMPFDNEEPKENPSGDDVQRMRFLRARSMILRRTITMAVVIALLVWIAWAIGLKKSNDAHPSVQPVPIQDTV